MCAIFYQTSEYYTQGLLVYPRILNKHKATFQNISSASNLTNNCVFSLGVLSPAGGAHSDFKHINAEMPVSPFRYSNLILSLISITNHCHSSFKPLSISSLYDVSKSMYFLCVHLFYITGRHLKCLSEVTTAKSDDV